MISPKFQENHYVNISILSSFCILRSNGKANHDVSGHSRDLHAINNYYLHKWDNPTGSALSNKEVQVLLNTPCPISKPNLITGTIDKNGEIPGQISGIQRPKRRLMNTQPSAHYIIITHM
jgi:hypothetical protein